MVRWQRGPMQQPAKLVPREFESHPDLHVYRGIEKQYLEGLISPSSWCDSRSRNQSILDLLRLNLTG